MIYECIQCQARQLPGDIACPYCGAQFAGPVPANATLEEEPLDASLFPNISGVNAPTPPMPRPPMMPPPLTSSAVPSPGLPTRTYSSSYEPSGPTRTSLPPLLLLCAGVGLLAILGIIYVIYNAGQTAVSISSSAPPQTQTIPMPEPQPMPTQLTMPSAGTAPAGDTIAQAAPIGRWMTKTFDFYEFDKDGTGTRGSVNDGKPVSSFSWTVVKNQLILSTDKKGDDTEKVPFSYAPGGDGLYLRQPDGQYLEFTRTRQ